MPEERPHISVCICTYKRQELLKRALDALGTQATEGLFTFSVVVVDNDAEESGRATVADASGLQLTYCVEPRQNIALARNKAVANAKGDFVAFLDDDEYPIREWLFTLFRVCQQYGVDGVLGPVKPYFESDPPEWVKKGRFFDRPTFGTGYKVNWDQARTGNVLFKRDILNAVDVPFRSEFDTAGEDVDFFRRVMEKGCTFVWCNEAVVYEVVPASRCNRRYLLKRALLRGSNFPKHPTHRLRNATKSLIAVPCYTLALPVLALFGQHLFLTYLIKLLDHSSRLLAYVGLSSVTRRQT